MTHAESAKDNEQGQRLEEYGTGQESDAELAQDKSDNDSSGDGEAGYTRTDQE